VLFARLVLASTVTAKCKIETAKGHFNLLLNKFEIRLQNFRSLENATTQIMLKRILLFKEVVGGKWSSAGNFLGECKDGVIIHIYKKQMENLGYQRIISDADKFTDNVKLPLYTLAYNKQFINGNNEHVVRLTAASIWSSYKDLIDALLCQDNIEAEITIELEKRIDEIEGKYKK
jgi:hypothetical protein